jgi:hypothetical protein
MSDKDTHRLSLYRQDITKRYLLSIDCKHLQRRNNLHFLCRWESFRLGEETSFRGGFLQFIGTSSMPKGHGAGWWPCLGKDTGLTRHGWFSVGFRASSDGD